ncbi:CheR family methyltransferase [Ohtaekwangia sp.]|uniref:CheR family methyltransferase n=1 Tax=Ohtaekwangia sp. TaxID=2066019 RepID=UPI002FDD5958
MERLSEKKFLLLRNFIYGQCGINLLASKKILLESRLRKRMVALNISSFETYIDHLMSPAGLDTELANMIDAITINKTDFFRESGHFQFMSDSIIPHWLQTKTQQRTVFKVWSAACSTGEEPYTIAMVLQDASMKYNFDYNIIGSDISSRVLEKAVNAIYSESSVSMIPVNVRKRYLLRSKDRTLQCVRIAPFLRAKVQFKRLNLIDNLLEMDSDFDLIFCRNLLIYFDRVTQEKVLQKLTNKIRPGGHLFIGHSESIYSMNLPLRQIQPAVFRRE